MSWKQMPGAVQNPPKPRGVQGERPSRCSSTETFSTQSIKLANRPARHVGQMENKAMEMSEPCMNSQDPSPECTLQTAPSVSCLDAFIIESEEAGEDLAEILKWARPLPRLLSPIRFPPATIPDMFGELSDSSDEEMDQDAQKVENISGKRDPSIPEAHEVSKKKPVELLGKYDSSGVNNESSDPYEFPERPIALKHMSALRPDPLAKSGLLNRIGATSKDGQKLLEENCEFIERNPFLSTKNIAQRTGDLTEEENKTLVCDLISVKCLLEQVKTVEPRHVQEVITSSFEQALNESSGLIKEEKNGELTETVEASVSSLTEDDQRPVHKGGNPQETEEPVSATENVLVVPDKDDPCSVSRVTVTNEGSEDIQAEFDLGRGGPLTDHPAPGQDKTEEMCEPEFRDGGMNLKFHSEADHVDEVQQKQTEVAGKDVCASGVAIKPHKAEEDHSNKDGCHKDSEYDISEKTGLDSVDALRPKLNITQVVDGWDNSVCCVSEVVRSREECSPTPSSKNEEGDQLKNKVENIINKDEMAGNILEETLSLVITKGCLHLEDYVDKNGSNQLLQEEPDNINVPMLPTQVSIVKDYMSQPEEPVRTNQVASELSVTGNVSELKPFEDPGDKLECVAVMRNISNSIQSVGVIMEEKCLTSEKFGEDGGEPLKITMLGATGLVAVEECAKGTSSGIVDFERPAQSTAGNSSNGAPSQEMTKPNAESISPKPRKNSVEDMEVNECCVTKEAILEMNPNKSSAQPMQDASQAENADPKTVIRVGLPISSEPSTPLCFGRNGPDYGVAANVQSSGPSFVAPPTRADHTGHCDDREHLMGEEVDAEHSEKSWHESLNYCNHKDKDEIESKPAGEQSASSETPGGIVYVKGCCDVKNNRELFEAPNPNSASPEHTSATNQKIVSYGKGLIMTSSEKIGSPSKNSTVELPLDQAALEEMDKIWKHEVSSKDSEPETLGDDIAVLDASASSLSDEEYPLRKVNPTKKHSRQQAFREEWVTLQNSQADVPDNMVVSSGIRELLHPAGNTSPKDEQRDSGDSCADEVTGRTVEHGETSVSDKEGGGESLALTSKAELEKRDPALVVNGGILAPETEPRGAGAEPSAAGPTQSAEQERTDLSEVAQNHFDSVTKASFTKECPVEKDGETLAVIPSENSIPNDSRNPSSEKQEVVSQKSELLIKSSQQNGAEQGPKPSDLIWKIPSHPGRRKSRQDSLAEAVTANTSTRVKRSPGALRKIRQEMGPPLPPLLPPLVATPPRNVHPVSPIMSSSSQFPLPSPLKELISPLCGTPVPPLISPLSDKTTHKRPALHTTSSPSEVLVAERTLSSPLQFCAATPKHALPVPGRFPPSAAGSTTQPVPQENSVKILDSMYPKLSARAITLNILKGNIHLSRPLTLEGKNVPLPIHQISGFKEIAFSSTAFVKTGTTVFPEPPSSNVSDSGKRMLASPAMPKSAKRLRLDSQVLKSDLSKEELSARDSDPGSQCPAGETASLNSEGAVLPVGSSTLLSPAEEADPDKRTVTVALEKMSESCFDLFPVVHSRVHVGNTPNIPIMTDEEKDIVYEFGVAKKCLAEPAFHAILKKLKCQKTSLGPCHIQSLCRVYVGICRQLGDLEKARLFCYSLLKEEFPQSGKLILCMGNIWSEIFTSEGVINKAIQVVARKRSSRQVLKCLKAVLNWKESGPADIGTMISSLLMAIKLSPQMEFQASEHRGEDLKQSLWEYVFAIDLLCSCQKWLWTHDHIISEELWPLMDKWIKNRKGSGNASSPSDVIVATVLRLIGRLGQIGLKEGFSSAVKNISSVIGAFLLHAKEKDVPWGVQLAAVYALCELGPSSPPEILDAIRTWGAVNGSSLPPAVTRCIAEVSSLVER